MDSEFTISVVIPTHNRKDSVLRTLDSLGQQTYPAQHYEAVVVDDGSTDGTEYLSWDGLPFAVRYIRQENAGATNARNTGALCSTAQVLIFMDDDMVATPGLIRCLAEDLSTVERVIVLATLVPALEEAPGPFASLHDRAILPARHTAQTDSVAPTPSDRGREGASVHFSECMTGALAVRREDFLALGMFQDPTGGWPNWDDVDFGYRAQTQGYQLWRSHRAVAYHHDHALQSLEANCDRWERASRSAVALFQRHPGLKEQIPTFRDKGPVSLSTDPPRLLVRKALRSLLSSPPVVAAMRRVAHVLERIRPNSSLLVLLYRWTVSAAIYSGYRRGLRELAMVVE